jgi:hypothetical protein
MRTHNMQSSPTQKINKLSNITYIYDYLTIKLFLKNDYPNGMTRQLI